ncbi:MAG: gluconate 2-dehydrogenase gamma chain [Alphaproteobacteria bacterium]|jgi:gluconate 2-dehydrogenase gamma chain
MSAENQGGTTPGPMALTSQEFKTVEAIAGRIMPATDTPGAIEAGSANYIDQALAGAYSAQLSTYQRAISELDGYCTATHGKSFAALEEAQQVAVLTALETGKIDEINKGSQFFALIRSHVMEGFFCEPQYGGNRDLIGWKLVGFPGQRYGYDDAYINRVIDLEPIACDGLPQKGD